MFVLFLFFALLGGLSAQEIEKKIIVSLEEQKVYAYEGRKLVLELKCSTGRPGLETPTGEFKVTGKRRYNRALPELGGASIPFTLRVPMYDPKQRSVRRIAFHEYSEVPDKPASNGCIRLKKGDAERLFYWADVGTRVIVQKSRP